MDRNDIKLSSNVTFAYKYIIPAFFFLGFMILITSLFVNFLNIELSAKIVLSFFSFIFCLFMIPLIKLNFVSYNENYTTIKGFNYEKKVLNKNVVKVKRFMFYFYKLFYNEGGETKKVIFLPHISGVLLRLWGKPKSIKQYEINLKSFP